jgi:iron(III) transport system ATP-binding protein
MSGTPALRVESLRVSYGTAPVLNDVTLTVPEHSFTAVLGPSGSGKTTLLRAVAGFERPSSGTVTLAGRPVDGPGRHVPAERRRIGYVAQEGALFPHLTVAANVGFALRGGRRAAPRVGELLDLVGLAGLQRRYPHQLSGGQQQRVALARALALSPSLVLMDEPFASLDAALRVSMRADIARVLRTAGTAVVLVTHDQQEALSLADQVAVLRQGQIAQIGDPRELYAQPADPELAKFLGEANLVPAEIHGTEAVTVLGRLPTGAGAGESPPGSGIALIRPEQITIHDQGPDGDTAEGLAAVVTEQAFHGHDSVVTLRPLGDGAGDAGLGDLRVRVPGSRAFTPGAMVRLSASGPVRTWPARPGG